MCISELESEEEVIHAKQLKDSNNTAIIQAVQRFVHMKLSLHKPEIADFEFCMVALT
jgi:hypothetical protein